MKLNQLITLLSLPLITCSCTEQKSKARQQKQVSRDLPAGIVEPAKAKPEEKIFLIDVRSAEEFESGHLEGAINIPHNQLTKKLPELTSDKTAKIHFYCLSGNRSDLALNTAQNLGYTQAKNIGAYEDLAE